MKTFKQVRQGDVFVKRIDALPRNIKAIPREHGKVILAHGEVTGHAHAISEKHVQHFRLDVAPSKDESAPRVKLRAGGAEPFTYLKVVDLPVLLQHEEHGPIEIPPGLYEVRRQREYTPEEIRSVAD